MKTRALQLIPSPELLAVCRLPADAALPEWLPEHGFCSVTRTADELSVVCRETAVPGSVSAETGWCAFQVAGPLAFEEIAIVAALAAPLAEARVSIFVVSTFDTDWVLVPERDHESAVAAWRSAGHRVETAVP